VEWREDVVDNEGCGRKKSKSELLFIVVEFGLLLKRPPQFVVFITSRESSTSRLLPSLPQALMERVTRMTAITVITTTTTTTILTRGGRKTRRMCMRLPHRIRSKGSRIPARNVESLLSFFRDAFDVDPDVQVRKA
jgi:hypothetical protein